MKEGRSSASILLLRYARYFIQLPQCNFFKVKGKEIKFLVAKF